jgi:uncharacterized protein
MKVGMIGIVLAAVMFSSSSYAFEGPSFNCRYARTADEVMVCQNAKLSELDRRMAEAYSSQRNATYDPTNRCMNRLSDFRSWQRWLKTSQVSWLRQRNACRYDAECIQYQYEKRLIDISEEGPC